eukprot:TRINITY_DN11699_c0_g1_i1.p1 TRINITY_DN11699_c0_g1~~TRINITY_DN11699_c0_g1_i1.p1  ORF type:complete len:275 (-),score=59.74 TRINITY_DN11699_c0_g1_i1:78-902(-)
MQRYKAFIQYHGSKYRGWHGNGLGVCDAVQKAIQMLNDEQELIIEGASRTDAGVHALKQVIHFDLARKRILDSDEIERAINGHLVKNSETVHVWNCEKVATDWHCRAFVSKKKYIYRIALNTPETPFDRDLTWFTKVKNMQNFKDAAERMNGNHNFAGFAKANGLAKSSPIKDMSVKLIEKSDGGGLGYHSGMYFEVEIESQNFLYRQVRNMVGCMSLAGNNKVSMDELEEALQTGRRPKCDILSAPAHGLYLADVVYDETMFDGDNSNADSTT